MARAVVLGFWVAVAIATSAVAGQRSPGNDLNGDGGPASRPNWYYQQRGGPPQNDWRWRRPPQFGWPPNQSDPPTRGCRTNAACIATTGPAFVSSSYPASRLVDGRPCLIEAVSDLRGGILRAFCVWGRVEVLANCVEDRDHARMAVPPLVGRPRRARSASLTGILAGTTTA